MTTVRALGVEDIEAYMALRREALEAEPFAFGASPAQDRGLDPEILREAFNDSGQATFGAFAPDLVGSVSVVRDHRLKEAHKAHVYAMYVTDSHRRAGTGRALMEAAIAFARSDPRTTQLDLSVSETAKAAIGLYEDMGFVTWGIEPNALRIGDDTVRQYYMALDLREAAS